MSKSKFNSLLKLLANQIGVPLDNYSTHSFRIGAATTAAVASTPDWKICMLGRWLSDSYLLYIPTPKE